MENVMEKEESNTSSTKRIAKNTILLYFRQIFLLVISLYTVRVILSVLGVEDYGIYNVVAGVVVLFSYINNAMGSSTQRYLNFNLGKGDIVQTKKVFSSSLVIHFGIAILFVILAESIGLWFVNYKLNIPETRHFATMIVYQFTILTTILNILKVPYHAAVIAYERMSFFAWMSIIEGVLKLAVCYLLGISSIDKLIFYSILLMIIALINLGAHIAYCLSNFETTRFILPKEKKEIKELLSFSGWSLLGATANVCNSQGTNIVLNLFTNVVVNAAMGIATQVNTAVYSFVSNFQVAFNPQIVKSYAQEDKTYFNKLIFYTSKISFFLLLFMAVPLYMNADFVLTVWLKDVPDYSVKFVQLILIWSLIDSFNGPLFMSVQATGDIKRYQIIISSLIFANLPLAVIALYCGLSPYWILYIRIAENIVATVWRTLFLQKKINLDAGQFFLDVLLRCTVISLISFIVVYLSKMLFSGVLDFFFSCFVSVIVNLFLILFIGFTKEERNKILTKIFAKVGLKK